MRAISADEEAVYAGAPSFRVRISVLDNGGTFRDLTTYAQGENLLLDIDWGEDVDSPGITWAASLVREMELLSLAPQMQTSGLNRAFDIAATFHSLLQVGRAVWVEYSIHAEDNPGSRPWVTAFTGYLDEVEWDGDEVTITGRGEEAVLIDSYIERERIYAYAQGANADRGCYVWEPNTEYFAGDLVVPTDTKRNGHYYRIDPGDDGTSGSAEPAWPTGSGAGIGDGTAAWTEVGTTSTSVGTDVEDVMQQIIQDTAGSIVLHTPVSPSWAVRYFLVGRQPLFDELRALADQIGWSLRYKYDSGAEEMQLTLYDPNRSTTTSLRTFSIADVEKITAANVRIFDIRNVVRVVYSDSQDLDASGQPKRKSVTVSDSASISKYGRRFCEIAEDSTGNIDSSTEATTLANAVLEDLREPDAEYTAKVMLFPFAELPDLYTLAANGVHFDVDQKLALTGYRCRHSAAESNTDLTLRGRPSSAASKWLQRCTDSYKGEVHQLVSFETLTPLGLTFDETPVGGTRMHVDWGGSKSGHGVAYELHISETSGFTPDSSTLVATGTDRNVEVGHLNPLLTYFAVLIPITFNAGKPVRGYPSAEVEFTPGAGRARHLDPNVDWGRVPLNGGFETSSDAALPPDFWFLSSPDQWNGPGAGGGFAGLLSAGGVSGGSFVRMYTNSTDDVAIYSAEFTINELESYVVKAWKKCVSGSGSNFEVVMLWYDVDHASISQNNTAFSLTADVGSWKKVSTATLTPPSGARFARVGFVLLGAAGREVHVDSIRVTEL